MACFYFLGAITALSLLPIIGGMLAAMLMPALYLGVMATIAQAESSSSHQAGKLFEALASPFAKDAQGQRTRFKRLAVLGMAYSVSVLIAVLLGSLVVDDDAMKAVMASQNIATSGAAKDAFTREQAMSVLLPGLLGVMIFYAPVSLAFWFTQQLVGWHGQSIAKAVFFSWIACWRNKGAFAVFSLAWVAVFAVAVFAISGLSSLLGSPTVAGLLMTAMSLLMIVLGMCSFYASYESLVHVDNTPE